MGKKSNIDDILIHNLKGFCKRGAISESPGNIPTGYFHLDFAIHYGMDPAKVDLTKLEGYDPSASLGLPLGKLVEIFGEEGGGKSSLAYRVIGYAQKMGYEVAWIDTEHSFSDNLAKINGCDASQIIYSNLSNIEDVDKVFYAEDILDNIMKMCATTLIKVIVVDSVANLVPKARGEADSEQKFMGLLARLLSENLGKITQYAEKYGVLLIFINQLREKINVTWGNPETSPGGRSLKHNSSLRLKISKRNTVKANIIVFDEDGEEKIIGRTSMVKIEKNRLAKPYYESIAIPIYFEPYFPDIEEIAFDVGRQFKLITVFKGVYKWNDNNIEGRNNFIKHIKDNNLVGDLINNLTLKALESKLLLPPELIQYKASQSQLPTTKS